MSYGKPVEKCEIQAVPHKVSISFLARLSVPTSVVILIHPVFNFANHLHDERPLLPLHRSILAQ